MCILKIKMTSSDGMNTTITIADKMNYILSQYWIDETDERLKGYPLISGGPEHILTIMLLWLLFVTKLGPKLMKNREPFVLREILMIYNFILVVINVYYIYASLKWLEFGRKSWDPKLPEEWSEKAIAEIPEKAIYAFTKLFDLCDTVFFVLRKKSNQITFLHVYHHFMVYATYSVTMGDMSAYPVGVKWLGALQPFIFFYMFFKFYIKSYKNRIMHNLNGHVNK
ncbi:unnamed protein product [Medioppia subpectinata]|uniref:Elongation of very long chain fatty acids protein n=1 Tax=Medioppia subpectinata TaxID=1979941 RepID=A0A7R9Q4N4_9ACAR|nr:unnamed protein product [Medioppia subpectinata]CAG2111880.1 unnamed protein product [Medioppia subpectinata]